MERDNPSRKGVLPKDYARPGLDKHRLGDISIYGQEQRVRCARFGRAKRARSVRLRGQQPK